jgi:PhzF family phenazine biosynthesis protein
MVFYIVHAFTERLFGGNPAGVVILNEDQDFPDSEICRKVAAELRYSETVFIKPYQSKPGHFYFRYFTPAEEVQLCGHATIGAFVALAQEGLVERSGDYSIETLSGLLDIKMSDGFVRMAMGRPEILAPDFSQDQIDEIYKIMGSDSQGETLKPQIVSTGLPDIMLPLNSQKKLHALSPDFNALAKLSETYNVTGVHAFSLEGDDATAHTRNFAPLFDIDEEAATGTASGALTFYLYTNEIIEKGAECIFIQGEAMNRPSTIRTNIYVAGPVVGISNDLSDRSIASNDDSTKESHINPNDMSDDRTKDGSHKSLDSEEQIKIDVGGSAVVLATGKINIPQ